MLVISRKIGQSFTISPDIEVQVLGYARGQVRIGISAPIETKVLRSELEDSKLEDMGLEAGDNDLEDGDNDVADSGEEAA